MWFLCGMAKTFKSWDVDQLVLLPPSIHELVPAGHLAHFVRDMVRDSLDLSALSGLFTQVLQLCQKAGLVRLGHVALDGTKLRANASKHKAMSYGRMKTAEPALAAEVARWLAEATASDAREDAAYGVDQRGDELPDWVRTKQHRLEKIRAAKAELEADAQDKARRKTQQRDPPSDRPRPGRPPTHPPGTPHDRAQRNFTDPDSRIMKTRDGFIQGYNAQAAVDADHQVIVAQGLTNQASDVHQLEPMLKQIRRNTGRQARGFRQFLLRGLAQVAAEWSLICSVHNLLKLAGARG